MNDCQNIYRIANLNHIQLCADEKKNARKRVFLFEFLNHWLLRVQLHNKVFILTTKLMN